MFRFQSVFFFHCKSLFCLISGGSVMWICRCVGSVFPDVQCRNNWLEYLCKGAFTPDANDANDLHVKSMQRRKRQSCGAIRANEAARIERFFSRELKNLNFGGYSRRVNQSGACSSSDVITSGGRKSQTKEDKVIWLYVGTRSCIYIFVLLQKQEYILQRDWSCCRSPSHDAKSCLLCSEFHERMKRVNSKCSSVQLRAICVWCERTLRTHFIHLQPGHICHVSRSHLTTKSFESKICMKKRMFDFKAIHFFLALCLEQFLRDVLHSFSPGIF